MAAREPGKRYPLVLYRRWLAMFRWPCLWIAVGLGLLWSPLTSRALPVVAPPRDLWALAGALLAGTGFLAMALSAPLAFVQCLPDRLLLQTPIFRLAISYGRIRALRVVDFNFMHPPSRLGWSQRRYLAPCFGRTALAVDLIGWPLDRRALQLFLNQFYFCTDDVGFLLLLHEWMEFGRELEDFREAWRLSKSAASAGSVLRSQSGAA